MPPQRKGRLPQYSRGQLEYFKPSSSNSNPSAYSRRPKMASQLSTSTHLFWLRKAPVDSALWLPFLKLHATSSDNHPWCPSWFHTQDRSYEGILLNSSRKRFHEVLWCCHTISRRQSIHTLSHGNAWVWALEEITCRVLGDLLEEGIVVKLADDLYCGADTPEQLVVNFSRVLAALNRYDLKLSASKTVIAPRKTTILGLIWQQGTLSVSSQRTATLASCEMPTKVKAMRSFLSAYKVLSRVISGCSSLLAHLRRL